MALLVEGGGGLGEAVALLEGGGERGGEAVAFVEFEGGGGTAVALEKGGGRKRGGGEPVGWPAAAARKPSSSKARACSERTRVLSFSYRA